MQKRTVRGATVRHDGDLVSFACHCAPLAAQPPATRPGEAPRARRWWMRWSVGAEWPPAAASALPLSLSCRVQKLVAHRASRYLGWSSRQAPLAGALFLAGARGTSRQVPWSALVGLPGKLLLLGSCLLSLNTLFLDGSKGTLGDLGDHPASLCRGVLQLPVHKFGVLGYP